jgi:hypothetical protein
VPDEASLWRTGAVVGSFGASPDPFDLREAAPARIRNESCENADCHFLA